MNQFRVYWVTCAFLMLAALGAGATTIVLPSDEQLISKTPVIVEGTVLSTTAVEREGAIWTDSVVEIARSLKGVVGSGRITISEPGGIVEDRITKLFGTPEFSTGEHVLLFLEEAPRGGYRTVDLYVGKFSGAAMQDGRRLWVRDDATSDVTLLDADLLPLHGKNIQREAIGFEAFVEERVAGRPGLENYGIENPVMVRDAASQGRVQSDFTLISEPSIYRWFRFASGQNAAWHSSGTQPGYSGGGVTELQKAMAAWTGYSAANIRYSYSGSRSGSMGGLNSANGVNEVLFNDPLDEISGSWNRSSGGVVGTGGFNGVSSRQTWTATFAADATHPAGTLSAWNITEGNLTIQDGVSAANGISSNALAEIVSHEFGHTLGFGHSAANSALMYASVSGIGPSLRTDDQTAARWLYPAGSGTPPPPPPPPPPPQVPAAPSILQASVSGSNVDLSWNDNASNETGHAIYLALGFGGFSKVGDAGANARTARLSGLAAGSYRIYVLAYNATGNSVASNTVAVSMAAATPVVSAAFDVSTQSALPGQIVTFTDRSTGSPTSWSWSFGDGATSATRNPQHTYSGPGTYMVTLRASNAGSSATTTRQISIASIAAYRTLVSVATYGGGVGGTAWRTELNLFNAGLQGANLSLVFLPSAGGSLVTRTLYLAPMQLTTYANALFDLFGIHAGAGALAIEASSAGASADLRVSSRTFTTGVVGTYGQSVPDVQSEELAKTLYITGIASSPAFRTNVGLVNRGGTAMSTTLTLFSRTGAVISQKSVSIPGNSFQQAPLSSFFPELNGTSHDALTMRMAAASSDAVSAYASIVDNLTQDPVYVQARPSESGGSLTIPVIGRAPGANGTFWRSDVTIYNPSASSVTFTLRYAGATKTVSVGGNDTGVLADVVSQFGLTSSSGSLQVSWSSSTGPVVTSRTYTSVATGGTFGQSIDPVEGFARRVYVPGLRNDGFYRSNVGFVNGGNETEVITVTVLSPSGTELGRKYVTLSSGQQTQTSVTSLFPQASLPAGFTMKAEGDSNAKLFAYGSMIDNASGDPVFFAGQ